MERLFRSENDRIIGGVCGGLGQHLNVAPLILRILFVVGAMANGVGLVVYILLWIFVPSESAEYGDQEEMIHQNISEIRDRARTISRDAQESLGGKGGLGDIVPKENDGAFVAGLICIVLGILILMRNFGLLHWLSTLLWPLVLIAIGAVLLLKNMRGKG
ncbi:MAG: PspC domain-containing protein [Anaerolineales bacterium]